MKRILRSTLIAGAIALAGTLTTSAQQHPMRPGRWEITTQMDMPGMPMKMPAQKAVRCITQKELNDPAGAVPKPPEGQKNTCKVSDYKVDGNKVTWKMSCSEPHAMTGTGEIIVDGDTYTGTMKMNMDQGQMTMKYNAKRLGDCEQ